MQIGDITYFRKIIKNLYRNIYKIYTFRLKKKKEKKNLKH